MGSFDQRWANVTEETVTTLRYLLLEICTATERRTLAGGVRPDMIARGGMTKDDLLDYARSLARNNAFWENMPEAARPGLVTLRGDIQNITNKMQAWE